MSDIHSQAKPTLKVVRLPILNEECYDQTGNKESNSLKSVEVERHRDIHEPAKNDQERRDEERNLQTASNCDANGEVHLIFPRDNDSRHMFRGVSNDWDENETNERFAHSSFLYNAVDASNQIVRTDGNKDCHDNQNDSGTHWTKQMLFFLRNIASLSLRVFFCFLSVFEKVGMRLQLEI